MICDLPLDNSNTSRFLQPAVIIYFQSAFSLLVQVVFFLMFWCLLSMGCFHGKDLIVVLKNEISINFCVNCITLCIKSTMK